MSDISAFAGDGYVSRETFARFEVYAGLLAKWNDRINLVAPSTIPELWSRHFADSAQLWDLRPEGAKRWLDLGSGAGFPGLVIAIIAAVEDPGLQVTLVESDQRKVAFLATVARETGVKVEIRADRVERLAPQAADVVSARALAPLPRLLDMAALHLRAGGVALFPKGESAEAEIADALAKRTFSVQKFPSRTDPRGVILRIGELGHA